MSQSRTIQVWIERPRKVIKLNLMYRNYQLIRDSRIKKSRFEHFSQVAISKHLITWFIYSHAFVI